MKEHDSVELLSEKEAYAKHGAEEAISILRKEIIAELRNGPRWVKNILENGYPLWSVHPINLIKKHNVPSFMDGSSVYLNLNTRKLSAHFCSHPNQFGACYESTYDMTYADFCNCEYGPKAEYLRCMQTEHDWNALFDEELLERISNSQKIVKKYEEEQVQSMKVSIPERFFTIEPKMDFSEITIKIDRMYGREAVTVFKENNLYRIKYKAASKLSSDAEEYSRTLAISEAAWIEEQLTMCIENSDETIWKSIAGSEHMSVEIYKEKKVLIKKEDIRPLVKYHDLLNGLVCLAKYGSRIAK